MAEKLARVCARRGETGSGLGGSSPCGLRVAVGGDCWPCCRCTALAIQQANAEICSEVSVQGEVGLCRDGWAHIARIRVDDHVPGVASVIALAEFFGDNPDMVLELAGVLQLGDMPAEIPLELRDLRRRYFKLDEEIRAGVLQQWMGLMTWAETLPSGSASQPDR